MPEEDTFDWNTVKKDESHNKSFKSLFHSIAKFTNKHLANNDKRQIWETLKIIQKYTILLEKSHIGRTMCAWCGIMVFLSVDYKSKSAHNLRSLESGFFLYIVNI